MEYYEDLLEKLKILNPGTKYFINRIFNKEKYSFLNECITLLKQINEKEGEVANMTKQQMRGKTEEFRKRISDGEPVDNFIIDGFALVREAAKRTLNMRHFDVQIIGGIVLYKGKIAEMSTGEGKTLVATLPLYLNALQGNGCHLVTVNDYLAKRDTQWMGPIFDYLGLSVGCIISYKEGKGLSSSSAFKFDLAYLPADSRFLYLYPVERKKAYQCDITYGIGSEFGFDYLRDNMAIRKEEQVQRKLYYAIIDEVDSILIDEARTPLIISGPSEEKPQLYYEIDRLVRKLVRDTDYIVDEEAQTSVLTEEGIRKCERLLGIKNLYDGSHTEIVHKINQALRAHTFFKRDKEYVVKDGQVIIVDEFTGRLMPGRKWSDGLHQAIEAKEGVPIESENQTLATISFQNYFKLYEKIAGMTGTAVTEAIEFKEIYKLDVIVVPTNKPLSRTEYNDEIYRTEKEKFISVTNEIKQMHEIGRPVLVGTISIEKAEKLSGYLRRNNIPHNVLHGKNHESEAGIIAQAGKFKAVTIATQMAGRGVDIILGGNPEIIAREETIKTIWSKKGSKDIVKKSDYSDVLEDLEKGYKNKIDVIEKEYGEKLSFLKSSLNEKEKIYSDLEGKAKEIFEKEIFKKTIEASFDKINTRLEKLKERYKNENSLLLSLQEKFKEKPERLKEPRETAGKAYRDYILYKKSIKKKYDIVLKEDIDEERNQLVEILGNFKNTPDFIKNLTTQINNYIDSLKKYSSLVEKTYPSLNLENQKKTTEKYIDLLTRFIKNTTEKKENIEQIYQQFEKEEEKLYENYLKDWEQAEKKIFTEHFPNLPSLEKEYLSILNEYEQLHKNYEEIIKKERDEYEKQRRKIEDQWQKAREELEKSPEEFKEIYETLLEKYKKPWEEEHQKVVSLGGLHVVGSERYEARRIDNQLKGRAGRQGDPGSSKFYLSLEDDLLRIFGSERLMGIMGKMPEGENITHPLITKMINNAQKKVEGRNFEIRKQLVEFDNVLNEQRNVIYSIRQDFLEGRNIDNYIREFIEEIINNLFDEFCNLSVKSFQWNIDGLKVAIKGFFNIDAEIPSVENISNAVVFRENLLQDIKNKIFSVLEEKQKEIGPFFYEIQRLIFLQVIDNRWKSHLRGIDELREGINLRVYAQRDPLLSYKHEGYQLFQQMLSAIKQEGISAIFNIKVSDEKFTMHAEKQKISTDFIHKQYEQFDTITQEGEQQTITQGPNAQPTVMVKQTPAVSGKKIGRNDPCPCGSGKKYKHCCGKNE
ncbi:MAG TPA: preprotein translocase subunit SecA [Candidatus Ratteibacteria bacterium]|nr:preprotein translocase subunit SecA [Candidatus Ratteibacteria bacterium]